MSFHIVEFCQAHHGDALPQADRGLRIMKSRPQAFDFYD